MIWHSACLVVLTATIACSVQEHVAVLDDETTTSDGSTATTAGSGPVDETSSGDLPPNGDAATTEPECTANGCDPTGESGDAEGESEQPQTSGDETSQGTTIGDATEGGGDDDGGGGGDASGGSTDSGPEGG